MPSLSDELRRLENDYWGGDVSEISQEAAMRFIEYGHRIIPIIAAAERLVDGHVDGEVRAIYTDQSYYRDLVRALRCTP